MRQRHGQAGQPVQAPAAMPADFQLREGLTITVSIIVDERLNVLLVPNSAIATQGRQTSVQVLAADGTPEQRAVKTGISDFQSTEIIEGLSEGEQIIIPQGNPAAASTSSQRSPGGISRDVRRILH